MQAKELFRTMSAHLGTERMYAEVRNAIEDMSQYLDSAALCGQGETMMRLTVVTRSDSLEWRRPASWA